MQKVARYQPLKLVSFIVSLWQNAFCKILRDWTSPVCRRTQRNFLLCLLQAARFYIGFGLDLRLYLYLANRNLPFEVCGKD